MHGFLLFPEWFFTSVCSDGSYFISPLRINGSALQSIFSVLKHTSGGNLSAIAYSPALDKLIKRKDLVVNPPSEKGYRDQILNIDGQSITTDNQTSVKCTNVSRSLSQFSFLATIAQSSLRGRQGSNACTIIMATCFDKSPHPFFPARVFFHSLIIHCNTETQYQNRVSSDSFDS